MTYLPDPPVHSGGVVLVVPVKETSRAKTRLGLAAEHRRAVALELAARTLRAALASGSVGEVLVVTSDPRVSALCDAMGVHVVAEPPETSSLNDAVDLGRRRARALRPGWAVGVLVADLPLVRPDDLDDVLGQFHSGREPLFVADHEGVGTTMLVHGPGETPPVRFGERSAAFHAAHGYLPARGPLPGLRQDLDTPHDLARASLVDFWARVLEHSGAVRRSRPRRPSPASAR